EQRLHHLLGDRAAALHDSLAADVGPQGAPDADRIDAAMAIEVRVLRRQEGAPHVLGNARERHQVAALDVELTDQRVVGGEDARRDRRLIVQQLVDRRQLRRDLAIDDEGGDAAGEPRQHRSPEEEPPEHARATLLPCHRGRTHVTGWAEEGQSASGLTRTRLSLYSWRRMPPRGPQPVSGVAPALRCNWCGVEVEGTR